MSKYSAPDALRTFYWRETRFQSLRRRYFLVLKAARCEMLRLKKEGLHS